MYRRICMCAMPLCPGASPTPQPIVPKLVIHMLTIALHALRAIQVALKDKDVAVALDAAVIDVALLDAAVIDVALLDAAVIDVALLDEAHIDKALMGVTSWTWHSSIHNLSWTLTVHAYRSVHA